MSEQPIQRGPFLLQFANSQRLSALLTRAFAAAPLTTDEFAVYSLLRLIGPTTPSQLASGLGMPASTMSHYLRRMADRRHLHRTRNPADGRSSFVELTKSGRVATEACFPGFDKAISAFRQHLDIPEKELLGALEAMNDALGAALAEPDA